MTDTGENGKSSQFERSLSRLEQIVSRLDRDELELDEALRIFQSGVEHLRTASRLLAEAREEVEELIEDASGELSTVRFESASGEEAARDEGG